MHFYCVCGHVYVGGCCDEGVYDVFILLASCCTDMMCSQCWHPSALHTVLLGVYEACYIMEN